MANRIGELTQEFKQATDLYIQLSEKLHLGVDNVEIIQFLLNKDAKLINDDLIQLDAFSNSEECRLNRQLQALKNLQQRLQPRPLTQ